MANSALLAAQIHADSAAIEGAYARLSDLQTDLELGDMHAADHAEERLQHIVRQLREAATRLENLERFTVTGERRPDESVFR